MDKIQLKGSAVNALSKKTELLLHLDLMNDSSAGFSVERPTDLQQSFPSYLVSKPYNMELTGSTMLPSLTQC